MPLERLYIRVRNFSVMRPPDTIFLLFLCITSGMNAVFGDPQSRAVDKLVPDWAYYSWSLLLLAGSLVALIGVFWRVQPKGYLIEVAGRWMLGPACFAYAVALIFYEGFSLGIVFISAFGITCIARIWYVHQLLSEVKAYLNGQH